ncbi:FMN-dependent NADH-azoreductase [Moritella yayanosii]|uniref:FMN dependent NADH:quinone oxidoreductase n=1 Tax=Moritella yayanosii TaxID=69539 RepID=A0A330LVF2_9GAMM|nr:NAD(P)H-dependent oxidoreductase [Moritella yayanosii]SQD79788.1 FMN-dependent NADH-azoreductase [Moritella yayanosii]
MTKKLLAINTSLQHAGGQSGKLVSHFIADWLEQGGNVVERDLAKSPIPHLNEMVINALKQGQSETQAQQEALALSGHLIDELREADAVVIGMPLYNLAAPSIFQTYLDYVLRAGVTFKYTEKGPMGLLNNKPVYILCTRGGMFGGDNAHMDTQTPWLRNILGFMGLSSTQFIYAEGMGISESMATESLIQAKNSISALFKHQVA